MKKVFMLLAVAAFFSASVVSCAEEKTEKDGTETPAEGDAEGDHAGHDHE